jgi:hypothetical protein
MDKKNNALKNAPHTQAMVVISEWNKPYKRTSCFPDVFMLHKTNSGHLWQE